MSCRSSSFRNVRSASASKIRFWCVCVRACVRACVCGVRANRQGSDMGIGAYNKGDQGKAGGGRRTRTPSGSGAIWGASTLGSSHL